jgi:hypothetical protein
MRVACTKICLLGVGITVPEGRLYQDMSAEGKEPQETQPVQRKIVHLLEQLLFVIIPCNILKKNRKFRFFIKEAVRMILYKNHFCKKLRSLHTRQHLIGRNLLWGPNQWEWLANRKRVSEVTHTSSKRILESTVHWMQFTRC